MLEVAARTAEQVFIPYTVGGGIRTVDDFRAVLKTGADKVSVNSGALKRPEIITEAAERFGAQCVVLALDVKRVPGREAVGVLPQRRPRRHRRGCARMGRQGREPGRGGDCAQQHGRRRDAAGL